MSKFDYDYFFGGYDELAVSKEKYTKEQAIAIAREEFKGSKYKYLYIGDGYVRHRVGWNEDNERCVCWWLEYQEFSRSCPCWVFHLSNQDTDMFNYERLDLNE